MPRFVAFLRGVNVGGARVVKMADLKVIFEKAGATDVATFIQSGNVLFTHAEKSEAALQKKLETALAKALTFEVTLTLRTPKELANAIESNPFPKADPQTVHVYFLPTKAPALEIDAAKFAPEAFKVSGREVYLHLPKGMGNSKLAGALARKLPLATARRIEVVGKIVALT